MGTVTDVLARDGDVWVASSNTEAPGTSQEVEVRFSAADMTPISSASRMSQAGMRIEADLQYAEGRVTGRLELPEQMGGSRDVDHEVPQGTLLPGMDSYIMAVADLAEGRSLTLPVFDMMSGSVTSVTLTVTGVESVTVPAGTFSTYRIDLTGGPQAMTVFVRQEAPHIMVRQEFTGAPIAVELQSLD